MKPAVYAAIFFLIIPFQAILFEPIAIGSIKPDLALTLLYIIGLLTGPFEAALAGAGMGLLLDIGSAHLLGFSALFRGLIGLIAGFFGIRVLDHTSPSNSIFLVAFSIAEGIGVAIFLQVLYGSVPFLNLLFQRIIPQALYTGVLGYFFFHFMAQKDMLSLLMRRSVQKEL